MRMQDLQCEFEVRAARVIDTLLYLANEQRFLLEHCYL